MQIKLINKKQGIYSFQLDEKNYIKFCPERGGLITNWVSDNNEILYFDEKRFMDRTKSIRGGIPILFPICGNLDRPNSLFGNDYLQLKQHGFARDLEWQYYLNNKKKSLCLFLNNSETTKKYYPFDFEIRIDVHLEINRLKFEINIQNKTNNEMPINFGFHPYFNISDFKNLDFFDFPRICHDQKKNILSYTFENLKNINNGIDLLMHTLGKSSFKDNVLKRKVTLHHEYPFDLCVIWSDPPRKMICIEPWTSPRNSLVDGTKKILIPPGACQKLNSAIQINSFK